MKRTRARIGVAALLSCAAGCLSLKGDFFGHFRTKTENVLVFNNQTEPEYLDPGLLTGQPDGRIAEALFEGLTLFDPKDLHPVPGVAERWDVSADRRTYTFHLRADARWTDGTPVTSADFMYAWERVLNPITGARYAQQLYSIANAELYNTGKVKRVSLGGATLSPSPPWADTRAFTPVASGTPMIVAETNVLSVPETLVVRDAPAPGAPAVATAEKGDILLRDGDPVDGPAPGAGAGAPARVPWVRVRKLVDANPGDLASLVEHPDPADVRGFVPLAAVEPIVPNTNSRTVGSLTPIRSLPDSNAKSVGEANGGDELYVLSTNVTGDWTRVAYPKRDRFGWVETGRLLNPRGSLYWLKVAPEPDPAAPAPPAGAGTLPSGALGPEGWIRADALLATADLLGLRAPDPATLVVHLVGAVPYFLYQTSHATLLPVPERAVEEFGPRWTRVENIVGNGPFVLVEHGVRDKFVLEKSATYWDHEAVKLDRVILFSIDNLSTSANMYRAGTTDLVVANDFPPSFIPSLRDKKDLHLSPALETYFYRINVTRPPLNDKRVRKALSLALNKSEIVKIKAAGELPATGLVPPGLPGYDPPPERAFDGAEARRLLAEAGYPDGKGFPPVSILYNSNEQHRLLAAAVQAQWREVLGIKVELENREWKTYLKSLSSMDYDVARGGWIGDYPDPNTFLELFLTGGGNNETGWSNAEYDALLKSAMREGDAVKRMKMLRAAEEILIDEVPILPIYFYVTPELRKPYVKGYWSNVFDKHPWKFISVDLAEANHLAALEG